MTLALARLLFVGRIQSSLLRFVPIKSLVLYLYFETNGSLAKRLSDASPLQELQQHLPSLSGVLPPHHWASLGSHPVHLRHLGQRQLLQVIEILLVRVAAKGRHHETLWLLVFQILNIQSNFHGLC